MIVVITPFRRSYEYFIRDNSLMGHACHASCPEHIMGLHKFLYIVAGDDPRTRNLHEELEPLLALCQARRLYLEDQL